MKSTNIRFGLRQKLFVLIFGAFCLLVLTTFWQIHSQAKKIASKEIERSLLQAEIILQTKINSRYSSIREVAAGIARDGRVLPLVFDADSPTLQDLSLEFRRALDFDILFFTDAEGIILARSDRPEAIGANLAGRSDLFDQALSGQVSEGVFVSRGKLMQMIVAPIFDNVARDLVRGTLALAYEYSEQTAQEINTLTESDIGFFVFERDSGGQFSGVKSTYHTNQPLAPELNEYFSSQALLAQFNNPTESAFSQDFAINGEEYHSLILLLGNDPLQPLGFAAATRSETEIIQPFVQLQQRVLAIGVVCLTLVSVFAWLFAHGISKPIREIVAMTQAIKDGLYPQPSQRRLGNDEIGMLHQAVVTMGQSLKEKSELESYLALFSEELIDSDSLAIEPLAETQLPPQTPQSKVQQDETLTTLDGDETEILGEDQRLATQQIYPELVDNRYNLIKLIGSGGMGQVYLALDKDLDERVAVKMMRQELFDQHQSINFKEEIRLARQITHRNVLRIFDFGAWQDFYYITMEYISGYDLGELLARKGALETHIGILLARQICTAMHVAHDQGIIHRDLKPANFMINRQGILKITDFGLAMRVQNSAEEPRETNPRVNKQVMGTPKYMAPEQFIGGELDQRTDIYAIGVILFEIFTGKPPYVAKDFKRYAQKHALDELPMLIYGDRKAPLPLQSIVHKAMAKSPDDRYQSVRALLDDLNQVVA